MSGPSGCTSAFTRVGHRSPCVCFNLRRAARAITQRYDEAFRPTGLRATQISVLFPVQVLGPLTISRLAEATETDRTTLTRNLRLLERGGLIRTDRGDDRRERQVSITERGRAVLHRVHPSWERIQGRMVKRLGRLRLKRLLADLEAVVAAARS